MGKKMKVLLLGGAIGATLGVLYAPRSGEKTRAKLADTADKLWGPEAQKNGTILGEVAKTTKSAVSAGQEVINNSNLKEKVDDLANNAKSSIQNFSQENVRPVFSEKNDELRKKIDDARQKISKQAEEVDSPSDKDKSKK